MDTELAEAVLERAGGDCEAGTPDCVFSVQQLHHRRMRSQGGLDEEENLLAVCAPCHLWIHLNPKQAYAEGWLLRP